MTKFTSKVKMPEPVMFNASGVDGVIYSHGYTANQMEAYANERVKEALEAAAQEVELTHSNSDDQDRFQIRAAGAVRALMPNVTE